MFRQSKTDRRPTIQRFPSSSARALVVQQHSMTTTTTTTMVVRKQSAVFPKPCTKLFLGDLSFHCTPEEIVDEFSKHGYYVTTVIIFRDYGFAHFKTTMLATRAHDELQGKMNLHGRLIRIHYAGRCIEDQTPMNTLTTPINSVYVHFHSTLDVQFDEAYLATFFAPHGAINDVCIKDVRKVIECKRHGDDLGNPTVSNGVEGFGFVHFDDAEAAINAASVVVGDEHTTLDCQVSVNLRRSLDSRDNQSLRIVPLSRATTKKRSNRGPYYDCGLVPAASYAQNQLSPPTQPFHCFPPSPQMQPFYPLPDASYTQSQSYHNEDYSQKYEQPQYHNHNDNEVYFSNQDPSHQNQFQTQHPRASWTTSDTSTSTSDTSSHDGHASSCASNMISMSMSMSTDNCMWPMVHHNGQDNLCNMDQFHAAPPQHMMMQPSQTHPYYISPMPPMSYHIQPTSMEEVYQDYSTMKKEGCSPCPSTMQTAAMQHMEVVYQDCFATNTNTEGLSLGSCAMQMQMMEGTNQDQGYEYSPPNGYYYYSDENGLPVQGMSMPSPMYYPHPAPVSDHPDASPFATPTMDAEAMFHANASSPCYQSLLQAQAQQDFNVPIVTAPELTDTTTATVTNVNVPSHRRRRNKFPRLLPSKRKQPIRSA